MDLEEEIKQEKGFASERHKAMVNIMFTESWLRGMLNDILKPHGLTGQQYNVLRILRGSAPKPLSTSNIRTRMLDRMSDASRIVDRLFKKGLVEKKNCTDDKRLVDVFITAQGMQLLKQLDVEMNTFNESRISITEQEAKTLNTLLDKLRD